MPAVGIIANPASGKDIRRLVAYGTVFDNQEKVNIVRRILLGLAATGVQEVLYMPDYYGIVPRAVDGLSCQHALRLAVEPVAMDLTGTQVDSCLAAREMCRCGVACIITLGGDGTNRVVAKGCGDTPLLPVSTGTNNVFPEMVEGTIAGLAAGAVANRRTAGDAVIKPSKRIVVSKNGRDEDMALIDAVVLGDCFIGSRAVWEVERIAQVLVTQGEPYNIGISAIAGNLAPVGRDEPRGLALEFGAGGLVVQASIAPGLIKNVNIKSYRSVAVGEEVAVAAASCVVALDGERAVAVPAGETCSFRLTFDGPRVIDVRRALRAAVADGYARITC